MNISQHVYAWLFRILSSAALRDYWRCATDDRPLIFAPLRTPHR
jgi:hypothetical protein